MGMRKGIPVVLLLMVFASMAFAGEHRIEVASIDKDQLPSRSAKKATRPLVIEKYEFYEVKGGCEKDLLGQMAQKGCRWDDGQIYNSVTSWSWQWEYGHDHAHPICNPDAVTVTLEVTVRYPEWVQAADAPQPLVDKWNDYLTSLMEHESGHRDMAVEEAAEFSRAVSELPSGKSCSELDKIVRSLSRERMEKLNADSQAYDLATNHGVTQGALFQ